jgi:hypothetical protein
MEEICLLRTLFKYPRNKNKILKSAVRLTISTSGENYFLPIEELLAMRVPVWVKPGVWGTVVGAIAMVIFGFGEMGWTTGGTADRMARDRADAAVVAAFVPFCVAKAQQDSDGAKLVKLGTEKSSYSRSQIVMDSGWATMLGMTSPDNALASACSDKLQGPKA